MKETRTPAVGAFAASLALFAFGWLDIQFAGNQALWGQVMIVFSGVFIGDFAYSVAIRVKRKAGSRLIVTYPVYFVAILGSAWFELWLYFTQWQPRFGQVYPNPTFVAIVSLGTFFFLFWELRKFSVEK